MLHPVKGRGIARGSTLLGGLCRPPWLNRLRVAGRAFYAPGLAPSPVRLSVSARVFPSQPYALMLDSMLKCLGFVNACCPNKIKWRNYEYALNKSSKHCLLSKK